MRRGVLSVTNGNEVAIATREAMSGDDLDHLESVVLAQFREALEAERTARTESLQAADEGHPADRPLSAARARRALRRRAVSAKAVEPEPNARTAWPMPSASERARKRQWREEGEPSVMRFVGQIGVLGWMIVTPTLIGLFIGRWLDHKLGTGIFWSAPCCCVGVAIGFWSAWRWMHRQ